MQSDWPIPQPKFQRRRPASGSGSSSACGSRPDPQDKLGLRRGKACVKGRQ